MIYEHLFKFIIIGDNSVGKSCLLTQYIDKTFLEKQDLDIGVEFKFKDLDIANKKIKLQIWTINGDKNIIINNSSIKNKNPDGIIIVYDCTNIKSFENIYNRLQFIYFYLSADIPIIIVGNKLDLNNKCITKKDLEKIQIEYNIMVIESSAKNNIR